MAGKVDAARVLFEAHANVNALDGDQRTPLMLAVGNDQLKAAAVLFACEGIDLEARDRDGQSALMYASLVSPRCVDMLLAHGALLNPAATCQYGMTLLHFACHSGNVSLVARLLEAGADINAGKHEGKTPLMLACAAGHKWVMKLLARVALDKSPLDDILKAWPTEENCPRLDPEVWTEAHEAASTGNEALLRFMIDTGAVPVNGPEVLVWGRGRPVQAAIEAKQWKCVEMLLDCPRVGLHEYEISDGPGVVIEPMHRPLNYDDPADIIRWTYNVLVWACEEGHTEAVRLILQRPRGKKMLSIRTSRDRILSHYYSLMLQDSFSFNDQHSELSPLCVAVYYGHTDIVHAIITCSEKVDWTCGIDRNTLLSLAVKRKHPDVAEVLCQHAAGAVVNVPYLNNSSTVRQFVVLLPLPRKSERCERVSE